MKDFMHFRPAFQQVPERGDKVRPERTIPSQVPGT
jgi:hypothetical protein